MQGVLEMGKKSKGMDPNAGQLNPVDLGNSATGSHLNLSDLISPQAQQGSQGMSSLASAAMQGKQQNPGLDFNKIMGLFGGG